MLLFDPDNPAALVDPKVQELRESFPEEVTIEAEDIAIPDHADVGELEVEEIEPEEIPIGPEGRKSIYGSPEMAVLIGGLFFAGTFLLMRSLSRAPE